MTVFQLARGLVGFLAHAAVELVRPHRCGFGCGATTHSLTDLERHYFWEHAGDRMTPPKGHPHG